MKAGRCGGGAKFGLWEETSQVVHLTRKHNLIEKMVSHKGNVVDNDEDIKKCGG